MDKKYELFAEKSIEVHGIQLFKIRALDPARRGYSARRGWWKQWKPVVIAAAKNHQGE